MANNRQQIIMKKSIFATLLAVVLTLGLASCTKTEKKIIGSWECTSAALINPEEGEEIEMVGSVFTFKDNNTVSITAHGRTETGTYSVKDEDLIINVTMTEEGMTVTLNMDVDILEITKTDMTIKGRMDYIYRGETLDSTQFKASFKKR